jgi:hypothetical protein
MKKTPQYIVIIDDVNENVSKSFNATVPNGFFFVFTIKKKISIKKTIIAYDIAPYLTTYT